MFDYIEGGEPLSEFLENYPSVSQEQAINVLNLAEKFVTDEKYVNEDFTRLKYSDYFKTN